MVEKNATGEYEYQGRESRKFSQGVFVDALHTTVPLKKRLVVTDASFKI